MRPDTLPNRSVRVFISSTFKDMESERAFLVRKTFPALRTRFRSHGIEILDVDLRWGISREEARRGEILARCLDEVDRCRPFFIGIIGDRYGWVPPPETLTSESMKAFPAARNYAGLSATEMEIRYGVLDGGPSPYAIFFFRRPAAPSLAKFSTTAAAKRAQALKESIVSAGATVIYYEDPDELGSAVEHALTAAVEHAGLLKQTPDDWDRDRALHDAYANSRIRIHVGAQANFESLDAYVHAGGAPLRIGGEVGAGKGALIANWGTRHRDRYPRDIMFEHYLAASANSANPIAIVQRLWFTLDHATGDAIPIPEGEMMFAELPGRLARAEAICAASDRRIVIMIDGLDKLESGVGLAWLPQHTGPRVRFVLSCVDGVSADQLAKQGCQHLVVAPLGADAREEMGRLVLDRVGKRLSVHQLALITGDPKCGSPIFLRGLLEELRVDASYETLEEKIARCLACVDGPALFELVLERAEVDCGAAFVRDAASFMLFARGGLEEAELLNLAAGTRLQLATLHHILVDGLRQIDGRLALGHTVIETAVLNRYVGNDGVAASVRRRLACHFARSGDQLRRADETPFQLQALADWEALAAFLEDPENLPALRAWGDHDLLSYWLALAETGRSPHSALLDRVYSDYGDPTAWDEHQTGLARHVLGFLCHAGAAGPAISDLAGEIVTACERLRGAGAPESLMARAELALTLARSGDFRRAAQIEQDLLTAEKEIYGPDHEETLTTKNNLAETLRHLGDFRGARALNEEVLASRMHALGTHHASTLVSKANLALALAGLGELWEARRLEEEVLEGRRRLLGARHPDTLTIINNLAVTVRETGDFRRARALMEELVTLLEEIFGPEHPNTLTTLNNLGAILNAAGEHEEAEKIERRTLAARDRIFGPDHPDTLASMNSLALTLSSRGDDASAETMLRDVVTRLRRTQGCDHPALCTYMLNWGACLHSLSRLEEAKVIEREALATRIRKLGPAHPDTISAKSSLALTLLDDGEVDEAVQLLEEVHAWRTEFLGPDHPETLNSQANLGSALAETADYMRAGLLEMDALMRRRTLLGDDHPDTLTSITNVACGLRGAGLLDEAMALEAEAFDAHMRRHGPNHPKTLTAMNNLAQTLSEMGETENALVLQERVLAGQLRLAGREHLHTLSSMSNLSVTLLKLGQLDEARKLAQEVVNGRTRTLGPDHPDTIRSAQYLEEVLHKLSASQL